LLAVATDGVQWQVFRPLLTDVAKMRPTVDDVVLGEPIQSFDVRTGRDDSLAHFYFWLQALLFRPQQTEPTAALFTFDFGTESPLWGEARRRLLAAWTNVASEARARTAFEAWRRYLRYTYALAGGESGLVDLFLRHTYLVSVARLLAWAALSGGTNGRRISGGQVATFILSGAWFRERGLANIVGEDFFGWVLSAGSVEHLEPLWEQTLSLLRSYDLTRLGQDVIKDVYEQLVNPEERHGLGEYYTPDWLCEHICAELLPSSRPATVLDPSCGSGGFLRAAIVHYRQHIRFNDASTALKVILDTVVGIDIHPLAVTIARVTYLLAIRDLLVPGHGDVQIPVYLADALFLPTEVTQPDMFQGVTSGYEIRFGPRASGPENAVSVKGKRKGNLRRSQAAGENRSGDCVVAVPKELVESPAWFDRAISAAADTAKAHASGSGDTKESLQAYLKRISPDLLAHPQAAQMLSALWRFTEDLSGPIRRDEDTIWAFVVRNAYRPAMLRSHFDFIVGNPPWLSYRFVADPGYQDEIRFRALTQYGLLPSGKRSLFTQMELATVFLAHTLAAFAKDGARLAFVMPRAVLTADQHSALRQRTYKPAAPIVLEAYWDLMNVRPLFNVPSCVLFARRGSARWTPKGYSLPATEYSGTLPQRNLSWESAKPHLAQETLTARLIYLGGRNALSTTACKTIASKPSVYLKRFAQGATLVPRNFYFVDVPDLVGPPTQSVPYRAFTDEEQARTSKKPWTEIRMTGRVEGQFLFAAPLAKHVLPFHLLKPPVVVLPYRRTPTSAKVLSPKSLFRDGWRETAKWMAEAEKHWKVLRPNSAKELSPEDWLDYQGKLTSQLFQAEDWLVIYNHSGTNIAACYSGAAAQDLPYVMDAKVYYAVVSSEGEAAYLTAVLNSNFVNRAIKPFQSTGLQGERDIHRKPLELPIPQFDEEDSLHAELAELGKRATARAAELHARPNFPSHLADQRRVVRDYLADMLNEIDTASKRVLT
jgi:hypothetical protein